MTSDATVTVPLRVSRTVGRRLCAHMALTKPHIIELLLIPTVPAMVVAQGGGPTPGWWWWRRW